MSTIGQNIMKNAMKLHYKLVGRKWAYLGLEQYLAKHSLVGDHTFYNTDDFPWVKDIEAGWEAIRKEVDEIMKDREELPTFLQISPEQKKIDAANEQGLWRALFLYGYGERVESNIARCPETDKLLQKIPGMQTAFFSILAPGKHIPPHFGPFNGVLRYHLGMIVPDREKIRIRVGEDIRNWEEGKSLVFDDTYEHEVWNESDKHRVVLFVDFERPLEGRAQRINRKLINMISKSHLVQDAVNNMEEFSKKKNLEKAGA